MSEVTVIFQSVRPTPVRRYVRDIPIGTYFIGTLVGVRYGSGFDAIKDSGVFYKTNRGITFLEATNTKQPHHGGGRFWRDDAEERLVDVPVNGSYVNDYFEVDVVIAFSEKR